MASRPASHYEQVFLDYINNLDSTRGKHHFIGDIKVQCQNASLEDLQESVEQLVKKCADRKLRKWMDRYMMPVVNGLKDYSQAIDQMVAAYPMPAALIWGGLRAVIETTLRFTGSLDDIQSVLASLTSHIWTLESCDAIYATSGHSAPTVQAVVGRSYMHILELWYKITKELRRSQLRQVSRALFRNEKLIKALDRLKEDADELRRICDVAEAELQSQAREKLSELSDELRAERELQIIERAAAAEERRINELHRRNVEEMRIELKAAHEHLKIGFALSEQHQRAAARRQLIESLSGDHSHNADLLRDMLEGRYPGTCEWLFNSGTWKKWTSDSCSKPVLWLHGKHGSGKSYICSAAIEKIRSGLDAQNAAFLFVTRDRETSRTQLLRTLSYQLVKSVELRTGDIPEDAASLIKSCSTDPVCFERLISRILAEVPRMFIFVDGLDEASNLLDMSRFVDFLKTEAFQQQGRLRLWLSSQYSPEIELYIHGLDSRQLLELQVDTSDTERDIARYLGHAIPESTRNADSLARLLVTVCVNTEVQGSFLWAAQMINDLKQRAENSDDMVRLAERGLPTSMHEHYKKTIESYRGRPTPPSHPDLPLWK